MYNMSLNQKVVICSHPHTVVISHLIPHLDFSFLDGVSVCMCLYICLRDVVSSCEGLHVHMCSSGPLVYIYQCVMCNALHKK